MCLCTRVLAITVMAEGEKNVLHDGRFRSREFCFSFSFQIIDALWTCIKAIFTQGVL